MSKGSTVVLAILSLIVCFFAGMYSPWRINRSLFTDRPERSIDVALTPVLISTNIAPDNWVRHYDVYVSRIPWRNIDSNYLPLLFLPRAGKFHKQIGREDQLLLKMASSNVSHGLFPSQANIDDGRPFIMYLDYISDNATGSTIESPTILPFDQ